MRKEGREKGDGWKKGGGKEGGGKGGRGKEGGKRGGGKEEEGRKEGREEEGRRKREGRRRERIREGREEDHSITWLVCLWWQEGVHLLFPLAQPTGWQVWHLVSCVWQAAEEGDLPAINCVCVCDDNM